MSKLTKQQKYEYLSRFSDLWENLQDCKNFLKTYKSELQDLLDEIDEIEELQEEFDSRKEYLEK